METSLKAIVKTRVGKGNVELREMPEPSPRSGQVKIRVEAAGICGTDLKIWKGETWSNPPVILGHEYSGVVAEIGEGVVGLHPGDRVISETGQVICGACQYCLTGTPLMCPSRLSIGYGVDGAFASHIVVRKEIVHRIPDSVSFDEAALCEPLAVGVHAVYDAADLKPADKVLVNGPGPIGLLVAQVAKCFGCVVIISGVDSDSRRLALIEELGIDRAVNSQREDLSAVVSEMTGGKGLDLVFDCSGAQAAISGTLQLLRRKAAMVQVGLTKDEMTIPYALLPQRELSIRGSFGHNWLSWEKGIELILAGQIKVKPLVSGVYPIDRWEEAFTATDEKRGVKILIHPNA
jgi:L-iditol 2-dehydrogenase